MKKTTRRATGKKTTTLTPAAARPRLAKLALVVFDFDGVMTDNRVLVLQTGHEGVMCNRSDGLGIGMLKDAGIPMLVLSKEQNPVVAARCGKLKLECIQGIDDKPARLASLLRSRRIDPANVAYVGNDLNDVGCMEMVGLPIAVADAYEPALKAAKMVTTRPGGYGAVREVCDW
ncbi:MAG: HAD hydrolase family protein, partial [Phycisphaerales bacterium]